MFGRKILFLFRNWLDLVQELDVLLERVINCIKIRCLVFPPTHSTHTHLLACVSDNAVIHLIKSQSESKNSFFPEKTALVTCAWCKVAIEPNATWVWGEII